jgi:DNA polymerase elongation subunit (family B)
LSEAKDTLVRRVNIWEGGEAIIDKRAVDYGVKLGIISGEMIKTHLPFPHDCEYEKTFWPFAILTKKRYVGNKYEDDPNKYKFDFMGIVLKRRDNAPIVKEICEGIINYLVNKKDQKGALNFAEKCIQDLFAGKYHIKYFLQSRTLKNKESYKNWKSQAHVVLANRMFERDAGSAPQSGDRLEFAVVKVDNPDNKKLLQGDRIETPKYIKDNSLEIDYLFYLTNQIMTPALQFLSLVDPNAHIMFDKYIEMYSKPKVRKTSVVKKKITLGDDITPMKKLDKGKAVSLSKFKLIYKKALDEINEIEDNNRITIPKIDYGFKKILDCIQIKLISEVLTE